MSLCSFAMRIAHSTRMTPLVVVLLAVVPVARAADNSPPAVSGPAVHEKTLANGLRVIVKEDHRAPVVVSQVWYKVGSSYEHMGITGISHVLEHMMFKGTPKHPAGEFSRIIAANGGDENAFTSRDYTAYYQKLEKSRLPISFELEADRMRHLSLPEKEYVKELKVVKEERRMRTEDNPQALTYEQFMAAAFEVSPYHNPVIGWMGDLDHLTVNDVRTWYQTWYAPNNATVVVVGDVQPQQVFDLAQRYFGPLKPAHIPTLRQAPEPRQLGERRLVVKAPAELPVVVLGYKVPVLNSTDEDWKAYAMEVLSGVLDGGDSARLTADLVRGKQIAADASAGYDLYARLGSLLTLSGVPAQGHDIDAMEKALRGEVARLRDELVDDDTLQRIKAQVTAAKVYARDSVFYQAMQIGQLETVGLSWKVADDYVQRVREVTPEQVRQVAREFLTDDNLTVARLQPLPIDGKRLRSGAGAMDMIR